MTKLLLRENVRDVAFQTLTDLLQRIERDVLGCLLKPVQRRIRDAGFA